MMFTLVQAKMNGMEKLLRMLSRLVHRTLLSMVT
jgi:hypothetical protein